MGDVDLLQQRRPEHRWPWLVSGVLYLAAGTAAWWATQLSWAACAGAKTLWSSILVSHLHTVEWSDACYTQMDSGGILQSPDAPAATAAGVCALLALVAVIARWRHDVRTLVTLAVAWFAASSFGMVSIILDYLAMATLSGADWDTPPGSGYLPALWMAAAGAIMIALTFVRTPDLLSPAAPEQIEQVDAVA